MVSVKQSFLYKLISKKVPSTTQKLCVFDFLIYFQKGGDCLFFVHILRNSV